MCKLLTYITKAMTRCSSLCVSYVCVPTKARKRQSVYGYTSYIEHGRTRNLAIASRSRVSCAQLSVIKFIQRAQTSSLNAIGGATRQGARCPCGGGSSVSWDLTWRTKLYCIDAARVVTGSKLVVQLQKSDADPVMYQYEEWLTNPCLMSAELAVVRTALTCYSGKTECPVLLLWSTE